MSLTVPVVAIFLHAQELRQYSAISQPSQRSERMG